MFVEAEWWRPLDSMTAEHDAAISQWFDFVGRHHAALFAEWAGVEHYRQRDRDGRPTGRWLMLFVYQDHAGFLAYKTRRKDWSGPYAAYKAIDPYRTFDQTSVTTRWWKPVREMHWPRRSEAKDQPSATR